MSRRRLRVPEHPVTVCECGRDHPPGTSCLGSDWREWLEHLAGGWNGIVGQLTERARAALVYICDLELGAESLPGGQLRSKNDSELLHWLDNEIPESVGPLLGRDAARRIRELRGALEAVARECERVRVDRSLLRIIGNVSILCQEALKGTPKVPIRRTTQDELGDDSDWLEDDQ